MSHNKKGVIPDVAAPQLDVDLLKIYVDEEKEKQEVLNRNFNWDAYGDVFVSRPELDLVQKYDRKNTEKSEHWQKNGQELARILMVFLAKLTKDDDLKYVLTLVDEAIKKDATTGAGTEALKYFERLRKSEPIDGVPKLPFGPLMALLTRKHHDSYLISKVCNIMNTFILNFNSVDRDTIESYVHWFVDDQLNAIAFEGTGVGKRDEEKRLSTVLVALRTFLSVNQHRLVFADADGLKPISKLCTYDESNFNFQRLYEALYILWLLSFHEKVKDRITGSALVGNLVLIVKRVSKDKVIRITVATLRNILSVGKNNEVMITHNLLKSLDIMLAKKWGDEDLEEDLKTISEVLTENVNDLTTWERYKYELESGQLDWNSPPHKSERFWTENFHKFEEQDYHALKLLKEIVENPRVDKKIVSVALWDIGEFVRFHPRGKSIVQFLEIKVPIMKLLNHNEDSVRREALIALQKLMVTNWEYLQ